VKMSDAANLDERMEQTKAVIQLLDNWGVNAADRMLLLGLPKEIKSRHMDQFRKSTPLPDTKEVNEHVSHLIGIYDALRTSYPTNEGMAAIWLKKANKKFDDRAPLMTMIEGGLMGLMTVRAHLDCTFAWYWAEQSMKK